MKYSFVLPLLLLWLIKSARCWFSCNDVEFCTRIRNNPSDDNFELESNFEKTENYGFTTKLRNTRSGKSFDLSLISYENEIFRIIVDDPDYHRHSVSDVLDGDPQKKSVEINENDGKIEVTSGSSKAVFTSKPFRVEISKSGTVIAILNNKGWMVFEEEEPNVAIALDVYFPEAKTAYGLPSHADHLALQSTNRDNGRDPYRFYNIDHAGYDSWSTQALYGAIPVLYAHSAAKSSGIFWMNSAQTFVDVDYQENGVQTLFFSESGVVDVFVLTGPRLRESVRQYAFLTGVAPLPQYFSLGYHQSRYSYQSIDDVKFVVNSFDENNFPLDVMWLDIDYTDEKKYFTWNPETYSDPKGLQEFLNSTGRQLVTIIDPHYAVKDDYFVYRECKEKGYFVKTADGEDYVANCWPGDSSWIDYFNPEARDYYAGLFAFDKFEGSTDIQFMWNDMNEPAVFGGYEASMDKDNVHYGGWKHRDVHNQYGFYQTMGTYKGLVDRMNGNQRPFVLTRSHFAGSQRYTAMWTGDNKAQWDHLQVSMPMCLNQGLGGMSFCGADIGGFLNNPDERLLQRWTQSSAWLPFFRQHADASTERREPYLFEDYIQENIRHAMQIRYFHVPYWYTTFYEHYRYGDPVMRPLVYHYPTNEKVFEIDYEWLVGENVLVRPVGEDNVDSVSFYLPGGSGAFWYDVENDLLYKGGGQYERNVDLSSNNYFYRGGSIVPRRDTVKSSLRYTMEDPITLYVFLNSSLQAQGTLYVDDGKSFDYTKKQYTYLQFTYSDGDLSNHRIDQDAHYDGNIEFTKAYVYRPPSKGLKPVTATLISKTMGNKELKLTESSGGDYLTIHDINIDINEEFTIQIA